MRGNRVLLPVFLLRFHLYRSAVLLPLVCVAGALAQDASTGALSGVVGDAAGAAVPAVTLTLQNVATGEVHTVTSDRLGEFLFSSLPPGAYVLRASANGFTPLRVDSVAVAVGHTTRLLPRLQVGGVSQLVEVPARPALSFDSPLNADLSPSALIALPQDGRRFPSFAVLTPLVSAEDGTVLLNPTEERSDTESGDTDNARLAVRGQDPSLNRYALNGGDFTRHFDNTSRGGNALPFSVSQEAVQEFAVRVVSSGEDDARARAAGGAVHTVTRRGGDAVHGSAFVLLRNSAADASNPSSVVTRYNGGAPTTQLVKPRDQRVQFGGSVGGPLMRGVFGFVAVDGQRRSFPAVSTPSASNFYSLTAVQTALLANRGVTAASIAKGLAFLDSLTGTVDRHADELALLPRVDWDGRTAHASVEWNHVRFRSPAGANALPVVARGRGSIDALATHVDAVSLRGTVSLARWLVDARAGYSRDASFSIAPSPLSQEPHTGPGGTAPAVDLADAFSFGNASPAGSRRLPDERVTDAAMKATFNGRAHTITVGASAAFVDERVSAREASNGRYSYGNSTSNGRAGALVDFLTDATYDANTYPNGGCPSVFAQPHYFCFSSFTQTFGSIAETRFHTGEWSAFASDRWRVTPRLQIDLGARYEWNRLPPPQRPNSSLDAVFGGFASTSTMPSDTNNLAPHAGVSYALATGTVVRLGYGFEFASLPGSVLQRVLEYTAQPASQTTLRLTPRTIIDPACTSYGTNFGYPATYVCSPFGPVAATGAAWMMSRGFQMPAVQTAELSVSHDLGRRTWLSGSYVLGLSRELTNTLDLNVAPATSQTTYRIVRTGGEAGANGGYVFHVPAYTARRTSAFGPVTAVLSDGNGTYHAMSWTLQHTSSALTLRTSWTWSKSLDTVRSGTSVRNENGRFDPFDLLFDRAASNFDHTHRITSLAVWRPEVDGVHAWARRVVNGWSVAPVVVVQSGRPYSYNVLSGPALPGGRESLNGSGGANFLPTVGRNTLRLPWTATVDLRLSREFDLLRDRAHLRLSGEAFNLFNHVNVTAVEQRAFVPGTAGADGVVPLVFQDATALQAEEQTGRAFGTPVLSAASTVTRERRLQAGLRLQW